MNKHLITAVLTLVMLTGFKAFAADYRDMVCIHNDTDRTIGFYYKWGNGSWVYSSVQPGYRRAIWWNYDYANEWWSPTLYVSFDEDITSDTSWVTYTLDPYASETTNCDYDGHDYYFQKDGYFYIDLYDR